MFKPLIRNSYAVLAAALTLGSVANASQYVSNRDGIFYYVRRVPNDVRQFYASSRISFSLRTKSQRSATRAASSVTQRLEDYWLCCCFKLHRDNQLDGCVTNSYFKLTTFRTVQVERDYFLVDRKITASLNINPILD